MDAASSCAIFFTHSTTCSTVRLFSISVLPHSRPPLPHQPTIPVENEILMVQHQQLVHHLQRLSPAPLPHLSRHTPSLRLTPPLLPHKHTQSIEQRCRRMIVLRNYLTPLLHVYSPGRSTICSSPRRPPRTPTRFLSHRSPILTPRRTEPSAPSTLASPARDPAQTRAIPRSVPSPRPVRARSPDSRSESPPSPRDMPRPHAPHRHKCILAGNRARCASQICPSRASPNRGYSCQTPPTRREARRRCCDRRCSCGFAPFYDTGRNTSVIGSRKSRDFPRRTEAKKASEFTRRR